MFKQFLVNAARNSIIAGDARIYERAFNMMKENLNGEQSVRNLGLPTPKGLETAMTNFAFKALDLSDVLTGLWLREYFDEHPEQIPNFTAEYFSQTAAAIAFNRGA